MRWTERSLAQVAPVEIRAIEGVEDELLRSRPSLSSACRAEKSDAPCVLDHDLAVEQRLAHGQALQRLDERASPNFSVQSSPQRVRSADLAACDARLDPIAVELDLVQPSIADRRRLRSARRASARRRRAGAPSSRPAASRIDRRAALDLYLAPGASSARVVARDRAASRPSGRLARHLVDAAPARDRLRLLLEHVRVAGAPARRRRAA